MERVVEIVRVRCGRKIAIYVRNSNKEIENSSRVKTDKELSLSSDAFTRR
jgi:hypothetical protein